MPAMESLLTLLKKSIELKQVTIKQLADEAGCSRQQIYNILSQTQAPTLPLAEKLAAAIGAEMTIKKKAKR